MRRRSLLWGAFAALILPASRSRADAGLAARLLEPGPLPEKAFGPTDAKVTIVEYASLTCGHCINFQLNT